ncbi:MAG: phosphate ABC transporter permease subunit PstC [Eubacterium sp.]|nr:phosphate ABC transporter permease subunit PstC [Eubacterium sp.]
MKTRKKMSDLIFRYILFLFTIVTVFAVIMIGVYMFRSGGPSIAKVGIRNFLFGATWDTSVEPAKYGILPFLMASVISMIGTVVVTVPVSILVAVGMSHFIPKPIASVLRTIISMLAGIPSVIYGFLGMILLVPFIQNLFNLPAGLTLISAIIVLIIMTLPTIISVSESSITSVPEDYMEASLALGVNREYTILHVIVPAAKSGILSAILLGLGRAVGETMAVIMVAGNVAQMPKLFEPVRFLTTAIVTEMAYASQETSGVLMGIGLVLFVFIVIINGLFYVLIKRTTMKKR